MSEVKASADEQVFALINGFRASQVVALAAELGIPQLVSDGPKTAADLAAITGNHQPSLGRLLGGLCALGVLIEDDAGQFHATDLSARLVPGQRSYAQARMLLRESYLAFAQLAYSIRTGRPSFELVHGKPRWEYLADDPDGAARFNEAMAAQAGIDGKALARASDLSNVETLVDVGGGRAALMAAVLAAHPGMQGIVVDLPAGLQGAREHLEAAGVADRCRLVEGSFFDAVPAGADAYVLRNILHDWDDASAARIAAVVSRAMRPGSRLFVIERLRPSRYETTPADLYLAMIDLQMLVVLGGRERTEAEFAAMIGPLGLELVRKAPLPIGTWLLEGRKL